MSIPVYFSRSVDAWLDAHPSSVGDVYAWAVAATTGDADRGHILPGYQPETRIVQVQRRIDITYVRRTHAITIIMLRETRDRPA